MHDLVKGVEDLRTTLADRPRDREGDPRRHRRVQHADGGGRRAGRRRQARRALLRALRPHDRRLGVTRRRPCTRARSTSTSTRSTCCRPRGRRAGPIRPSTTSMVEEARAAALAAPHLRDAMSDGCTNCGNKGGCDARKHEMFGAIDEALARLYPTRRWDERDEAAGVRRRARRGGGGRAGGGARGAAPAPRRSTVPARPRRPATTSTSCASGARRRSIELREAALDAGAGGALRAAIAEGAGRPRSTCASRCRPWRASRPSRRCALTATRDPDDGTIVAHRGARARGSSSRACSSACRRWSAVLRRAEHPPPRLRRDRRGAGRLRSGRLRRATTAALPGIANYLFYPQPPAAIATTTLT